MRFALFLLLLSACGAPGPGRRLCQRPHYTEQGVPQDPLAGCPP